MVPPIITWNDDFNVGLPFQFDFGTIVTGSSGSVQTWRIWNNRDAVFSSVVRANRLNLTVHDQGVLDHATWTANPQAGWIFVRGREYNSGSTNTGSADTTFTNIYGNHTGSNTLTKAQNASELIGTGSAFGGNTGSYWRIDVYASAPQSAAAGTKSGSICLQYNYL